MLLRRVEREIATAEPVRSETLLELGADLEDAYRTYRERGLGDEEATRRAEALLVLDVAAIRELSELHASWMGHLLAGDTREAAVQRTLFGMGVMLVALILWYVLRSRTGATT